MSGQTTLLQIDLQNLFTSSNHSQKLDLEKIWDDINDRDSEILSWAIIYTVRSPDFDTTRFETKLKTIGYDLKTKNISKRRNRSQSPENLDVLITMDCILKQDFFDKLILITNNGAYSDLCRYLRSTGKKIEIWSFRDNFDPNLELYADKIVFLDDGFCLKKPNISVFGINWGLEKLESFQTFNGGF